MKNVGQSLPVRAMPPGQVAESTLSSCILEVGVGLHRDRDKGGFPAYSFPLQDFALWVRFNLCHSQGSKEAEANALGKVHEGRVQRYKVVRCKSNRFIGWDAVDSTLLSCSRRLPACYYKHACPIPLYTPQTLNRHNLKLQAWHNPALNSNIMILHGGSVQSLAANEAF